MEPQNFNSVHGQFAKAEFGDVQSRVAAQRKYIHQHGSKQEGVAPGCGPNRKPEWFNPVEFAHAQTLFKTYEVGYV